MEGKKYFSPITNLYYESPEQGRAYEAKFLNDKLISEMKRQNQQNNYNNTHSNNNNTYEYRSYTDIEKSCIKSHLMLLGIDILIFVAIIIDALFIHKFNVGITGNVLISGIVLFILGIYHMIKIDKV